MDKLTEAEKTLVKKLAKKDGRIAELKKALQLILEVHPTRNSHEVYVATVRELAEQALKK